MDIYEFLEEQGLTDEGWDVDDPAMGMDALLVCPHGNTIELDGRCPEGCVSPLIKLGMI